MQQDLDDNPCGRFSGWQRLPSGSQIVDSKVLGDNLARMQRIAASQPDVQLMPHVMAHNALSIATLQQEAGAAGFTVGSAEQAMLLLGAGFAPVTLARPERDCAALAALMPYALAGQLRFVIDGEAQIAALQLAQGHLAGSGRVDVLVKIDVGQQRYGIPPQPAALGQLVARLASAKLRYAGILSYAGHSYSANSLETLRQLAAQEGETMRRLAAEVPVAEGKTVVSIGATPALLAGQSLAGMTEIRPGNYALMDLGAVAMGLADRDQLALAVVARITDLSAGRVEIDIGAQLLTAGQAEPAVHGLQGFGEIWHPGAEAPMVLQRISADRGMALGAEIGLRVGSPVLVLPNRARAVRQGAAPLQFLPAVTADADPALSPT